MKLIQLMNIVAALIKWFIFVGTHHVMNLFIHVVCIKKNKKTIAFGVAIMCRSAYLLIMCLKCGNGTTGNFGIDDQCQMSRQMYYGKVRRSPSCTDRMGGTLRSIPKTLSVICTVGERNQTQVMCVRRR